MMKTLYFYVGADEHLIVEETGENVRFLSEHDFTGDLKTLHERMFDVPQVKENPYAQLLYAIEWTDLMAHAMLEAVQEDAEGWKNTIRKKEDLMPDSRLIAATKREVTL